MTKNNVKDYNCDICHSDDSVEIPEAKHYTNNQPIHVCCNCGFVYVKKRRSADSIAKSWSEELFGSVYTAKIPAVAARQKYVAETIDSTIGLKGKRVCDIGSGEGLFPEILRQPDYGAEVFAIEPSEYNCQLINAKGIQYFVGTIEEYIDSPDSSDNEFNIVTILWTLENCQNCRTMLEAAYSSLEKNGKLVVATGSRILVPFKKPLHTYLSTTPIDTHAFRFSANTLQALFILSGFKIVHINRFIDTDYLVIIGEKISKENSTAYPTDNYKDVLDFFRRWHEETKNHFPANNKK